MAGRTGDRQQAPPAKPPEKPGEKSAGNGGRDSPGGRHRRSGGPSVGTWAEAMQGTPPPLQNRRAEGFYARGIRIIPGLYTPPYSPPKAMQEPPAIPAKSHSRSHQHRGQAPQRTGQAIGTEATAEAGTAIATTTSQHSTTTAAPNQHNSRTAPPQADRTGAPATATGPTMTTGPARRAVGTPGGDCEVCGFGSAKVF